MNALFKSTIIKTSLIFLFIISLSNCNSIELSPAVQGLVQEMTTEESFDIGSFWVEYHASEAANLLNKLNKVATTEELVVLTKHQHKKVKVLSSMALVDRNYDYLPKVFISLLHKNERIWTGRGMHGEEDQLAGIFYRYVDFKIEEIPTVSFYKNIKKQLDSTLLTAHFLLKTNDFEDFSNDEFFTLHENRLDILEYLLYEIKPLEKYYSAIRVLCKKGYQPAFRALAKFQKEEDIPLMLESNNLSAIAEFPHPAFWENLKAQKKRDFYWAHAVAAYRNKAASELLLANIDDINQKTMSEVISKYYTPFYDTIGIELWEKHQTIDWKIAQALVQKDAQQAAFTFVKGLKGEWSYTFSDNTKQHSFFSAATDSILELMLETITLHQKNTLPEICPIIVSKEFYPLAFIKKYQIKTTADAIMKSLKSYNNHYEELKLAEIDTLLSFRDDKLTKIVLQFLKEDFSSWEEKFYFEEEITKMLKKYNLPAFASFK